MSWKRRPGGSLRRGRRSRAARVREGSSGSVEARWTAAGQRPGLLSRRPNPEQRPVGRRLSSPHAPIRAETRRPCARLAAHRVVTSRAYTCGNGGGSGIAVNPRTSPDCVAACPPHAWRFLWNREIDLFISSLLDLDAQVGGRAVCRPVSHHILLVESRKENGLVLLEYMLRDSVRSPWSYSHARE